MISTENLIEKSRFSELITLPSKRGQKDFYMCMAYETGGMVHNISYVKLLGTKWLEIAIQITVHKENKLCH